MKSLSPEIEAVILADTKANSVSELTSREYKPVKYNRKQIMFFKNLFSSVWFSMGKFSTPSEVRRNLARKL